MQTFFLTNKRTLLVNAYYCYYLFEISDENEFKLLFLNLIIHIPNNNNNTFNNKFYEIIDQHVPIFQNFKLKYPVWYTSKIIKLIKEKFSSIKNLKLVEMLFTTKNLVDSD